MFKALKLKRPWVDMYRTLRRVLNREINQLSYNYQLLVGLGVPEVFQIELTNKCPMTCIMCPRTYGMTRMQGYIDVALFERIAAQIAPTSSRILLHHFGDSLLHPQLGDILRLATAHGLTTGLSANPILLTTARIRDLVDGNLDELVLSLDGVTPETNRAVRGKAAQNVDQAEQNIQALLAYREQRGRSTPRVILQFVEHRLNSHEKEAWLEKWRGYPGLEHVKLKEFVSWDGQHKRINSLRLGDAEPSTDIVCDKPWMSVTILWDGRVVPCCFDHNASYVLGDLRHHTLHDIFSTDALYTLRRAHRDRKLDGVTLCAQCIDKEGYKTHKLYYPFNRLIARSMPLGAEQDK